MTIAAPRGLSPVRAVLDSGAVVLAQETSMTAAVTINATVMAGGAYEPATQPGLAYLMGRVLDRGTIRRSAAAIAEDLDDRGVALRVATARHPMTVTCTCLAEDFHHVLRLVLEIVRSPTFPEAELAKRRAECLTALRQDQDNTGVRAAETLFELLYGSDHPYGRKAKGTEASVSSCSRDDLVRFHASRFHPSLLTLIVVGDVEAERAIAQAAIELDGWTGPAVADPPIPPPCAEPCRRERQITIPGKSQADIAYGFTTITRLDPRYYAYYVLNNILGQFGLGGRLADNIRERQGMAYYAYSAIDPSVGPGPLLVRAGVDPENVGRTLDAIDFEVGTLGREGPTADELSQSKEYLIGSIPRLLETNPGIASFLLAAEQFGLGLDYDRELPGHLQAVTLDEVHAAAAELLDPARAAVAIAGP